MQDLLRIKEAISNVIEGKYKILFVHPSLEKEFKKELEKYISFLRSTFSLKINIYRIPEIESDISLKEIKDTLGISYIYEEDFSLYKLYFLLSLKKAYLNERFICFYDINLITYHSLSNLDEFNSIISTIPFLGKDCFIPINSLEEFEENLLNPVSKISNSFIIKSKEEFCSSLKEDIIKNKKTIVDFIFSYGFISLNEDDCINWHKFLCKNIFGIPYTEFSKFIISNFKDGTRSLVSYQTNNYISIPWKKISFNRNEAFDLDLKNLFNYSFLENSFIPAYLNILHSFYHYDTNYIFYSQIKEFYKEYPQYFSKLIYTLMNISIKNKVILVYDR